MLKRIEDNDGWRWYTHGNQLRPDDMFAGVTGILQVAVPEKLKNYFVNNSATKQEKTLQTTGDIGTAIHDLIERDLKGEEITPPKELEKPFSRWQELKKEHNIKAKSLETMVCSQKYGFAGTFDGFGEYDGRPMMWDIKTGYVGVKAGWQMAAYRLAALEMNLIPPETGMVVFNIKRDGSVAKPLVYEHIDWALKSFVCTYEIWKSFNFYKLDRLKWPYLKDNSLKVL